MTLLKGNGRRLYERPNERFSAFSLDGELSRYLNISCILTIARILRESVDGSDAILLSSQSVIMRYWNDVIVPDVFHALYEVKSELHTEVEDVLRSCLENQKMPDTMSSPPMTSLSSPIRTQGSHSTGAEAKSFHADTYCFDSKPEKECFLQYISKQ